MKRDLAQLSRDVHDVLIIGGGIYGVFVAWDAALRGLSVALVEKGDFGHATSSQTLRIIHGGFRYLQHGDIRRMRRSIHERRVFMQIASHLVHPLPFLIPTYGHALRGKGIFAVALMMHELIGFDRNRLEDPQKYLPPGRIISREECLRLFPGIEGKGLTGGAICYDCQMSNSERLVLSVARSASRAGAAIANYLEVTGLLREGGRVAGTTARDVLTGDALDIRARLVVNTTGPWSGRVLAFLNGPRPNRKPALSKAFNLLIKRQLIPQYAVGIYSKGRFADPDAILSKGSRLFFITPWHNRSLIGTAHLPYAADPDSVRVSEREIQAFLDEINAAYPAAGLKRQDVCSVYGGLLPMAEHSSRPGDVQLIKRYRISDHQRDVGIDGLISAMGVKFTEARYVAEKTVDLAFTKLGRRPLKSLTAATPLYGGGIERFDDFVTQEMLGRPEGVSAAMIRHLIYQYGSAYREVLKYLDANPHISQRFPIASPLAGTPLASPVRSERRGSGPARSEAEPPVDDHALMKAMVLHGIREEMAQKLPDVVFRRTALGMAGSPEDASLKICAAIMSKELGWEKVRAAGEVDEVKAVLSTWTGTR